MCEHLKQQALRMLLHTSRHSLFEFVVVVVKVGRSGVSPAAGGHADITIGSVCSGCDGAVLVMRKLGQILGARSLLLLLV